MKYKVGDKVRVKSWDKMVEEYGMYNGSIMSGDVFFIKGMRKFCGEILEVVKVRYDTYEVAGENDAGRFVWTDEMFEDISDDELAEELWGELTVPSNNVNHPSHYNDGNIEVIDYIEDKKLGFHLGNAIKYISRAGKKDKSKTREDIEKAIWYLKRYLEVE